MAINFDSFTLGTTQTIQSDDYVVGFDTAVPGGERKWTISTLANAVSSITSLGTVKSVTGTAPISVANGTTTPAISIAAATTSAAGSMSSTDKTRLDSASVVNGLVKCNGSGSFSAAVAGTDYLTSASLAAAKAWVNFNGTGTIAIRSSYNVTSIGDVGTGQYRINVNNGVLNNSNYSVLITGSYPIAGINACAIGFESLAGSPATLKDKTTTGVEISYSDNGSNAYLDVVTGNVVIFSN